MFRGQPRTMTTDPRDDLFRAADLAGDLLETVREEDHDRPTPCAEWSVLDLVGHLVQVTRRVAHIGRGGRPDDVATMSPGAPAEGWGPAYRAGVLALRAVWADDAVLTATLNHPAGPLPGAVAGTIYVQEFTTHAGDLAVALGRTDLLDEELAERTLAGSLRFVPRERAGFPFGDPVEVPDDAPAHVRLAAWLGRG